MTDQHRVVIVGAGFGGLTTALTLKHLLKSNIKLTIINPTNYFQFTPMIHEVATGGVHAESIIEPIRKALHLCAHELIVGCVDHIDIDRNTLRVGTETILYDSLVLAPGSETNFFGNANAERYSYQLKNIHDALQLKQRFLETMEAATREQNVEKRKQLLSFVIVGGGPTGVELAAEMAELFTHTFARYYNRTFVDDVSMTLITRDAELIMPFSKPMRTRALNSLKEKGIRVKRNATVIDVQPDYIILEDGERIDTQTTIWVAGVRPVQIPFSKTQAQHSSGRLIVDESLRLKNAQNIYAIGDAAACTLKGYVLPPLAQVATKQGVFIAKCIAHTLHRKPLQTFQYRHAGTLLSLGRLDAIAEIAGFRFSGLFAWWLWRTIYLTKFISWRKKLEVAIEWTRGLFSHRDISNIHSRSNTC